MVGKFLAGFCEELLPLQRSQLDSVALNETVKEDIAANSVPSR